MSALTSTLILCRRSPITWMNAALTLALACCLLPDPVSSTSQWSALEWLWPFSFPWSWLWLWPPLRPPWLWPWPDWYRVKAILHREEQIEGHFTKMPKAINEVINSVRIYSVIELLCTMRFLSYIMLASTAQPAVISMTVPSIVKSSSMSRSTARYTSTPVTSQMVKTDSRAPKISENIQ